MNEEIKFIICPHCGALLEKGVTFCGFCGKSVDEKEMSYVRQEEEVPQKIYGKPPPGYAKHHELQLTRDTNSVEPSRKYGEADLQKESLAEAKIRSARLLSWLAFCLGLNAAFIGTIVAAIAIVYCIQAKKLVGNDPRIAQSMAWAIAGGLLGIVMTVVYVLAYINGWFPTF